MSATSTTHKIPSTCIYLNSGGISTRVIDFINSQKNPDINLYVIENPDCEFFVLDDDSNKYSPYLIELKNQSQEDINTFLNKLALIYPVEIKYDYTPSSDVGKRKSLTNKSK